MSQIKTVEVVVTKFQTTDGLLFGTIDEASRHQELFNQMMKQFSSQIAVPVSERYPIQPFNGIINPKHNIP